MTDLIALAKQVGATTYTNRHFADRTVCAFLPETLQAFAELIRQDERGKCAKVCDDISLVADDDANGISADCAAAIKG